MLKTKLKFAPTIAIENKTTIGWTLEWPVLFIEMFIGSGISLITRRHLVAGHFNPKP
jgi:hypothetical protein